MKLLLPALLFSIVAVAQTPANSTWALDSSTVTYKLTHPVHEIEGTSHQSRGKGICRDGKCQFLIATPVKTFDSGDTNRDLHMLQAVRGAENPLVTVRFTIPQSAANQKTFNADMDVNFAGQTKHYQNIAFTQTVEGSEHVISGTIPSTMKDFNIDPPRFLTVPAHNEIPVRIEAKWHENKDQ